MKCPWLVAVFLLLSLVCTSRLLLLQHRHVIGAFKLHTNCLCRTHRSQPGRMWISGASQRDPSSVLQFKVALELCSLEKDTCGCDWSCGRKVKNCLFNKTCQGFAVHTSTLLYFWKSLSPFASFCMTTGVLYGTVVEETLIIICVNHRAHHVVSNLTVLAFCVEGRGKREILRVILPKSNFWYCNT